MINNKKAVLEGFTWFFAIITVALILIVFYIGSLSLGSLKKVDYTNPEVLEQPFSKLESLWDLQSFLFFKENVASREIYSNLVNFGIPKVPEAIPASDVPLSTSFSIAGFGNQLMADYFSEYIKLYSENSLLCYMLIVDNFYSGKSCIDFKLNKNSFAEFSQKMLPKKYFNLSIGEKKVGISIGEVKNE